MPLPSPLLPPYATYRLSRGETHVFSSDFPYVTYKAALLPLWRFRTPAIARTSADAIYERFLAYDAEDDFVGMDMCRKYLQMGMTRAKRYANYSGGRKYDRVKGEGEEGDGDSKRLRNGAGKVQKEKSEGHKDQRAKEEASQIFRRVWERARTHGGYVEKKRVFLEKQKRWDRDRKMTHNGEKARIEAEPEIKADVG